MNDQGKICYIWRTNEPHSSLPPTATTHDEFLLVIWKLRAPSQIRVKRRLSQIGGPQNEKEYESQNCPNSSRYLFTVWESVIIFEIPQWMNEGVLYTVDSDWLMENHGKVPDRVAFMCCDMRVVYSINVVENTSHYPLLQSNWAATSVDWFKAPTIPRENAIWAKFRGLWNENETEIRKNGPTHFRYWPIL